MRFTNPILYGDYSDPDVIRVGDDFYMIASSFTYVPGIPVLHSKNLVQWELIGYAASHLPFDRYNVPQHGCGTWAPSLRWRNGLFYVYVCLPDEGLFAFTAKDPAGKWECHWVKDVCGWIDPCPLFDDDGRAWLVHGFANSRCGIKNILYLHEMSPDGLKVLDTGKLVYSGDDNGDTTVEGPKCYKRNGLYWILCPAGGVKTGYQLALRSRSVYGPYERRVVLTQGDSPVNGPHQGGWVDDGRGGDWFIHFQDVDAYGRITHLQPVDWSDGWPMMGDHGVPVRSGDTGLAAWPAALKTSDEFRDGLGLQWQWQANPNPAWYRELNPGLRLYAAPSATPYQASNFLSQLMQSRNFDMETCFSLHAHVGDVAGLAMMGNTYHSIALQPGRVTLVEGKVQKINRFTPDRVQEQTLACAETAAFRLWLRMRVRDGQVSFSYAEAEGQWQPLGGAYPLVCGGWVGARPGVFCINTTGRWGGWADVQYVRVDKK